MERPSTITPIRDDDWVALKLYPEYWRVVLGVARCYPNFSYHGVTELGSNGPMHQGSERTRVKYCTSGLD